MTRSASLAMYEPGGAATALLWEGLRRHFIAAGIVDAPAELEVPVDYEKFWLQPDMLFSQTCGYPLRNALDGKVQYLATPVYDVEGTDGPYYRSAFVVRASDSATTLADLRGRRAAFNSPTSQSGYNAFRSAIAPLARQGQFFAEVVETGSHAGSLRAIVNGRADVAAIDPVSLALTDDITRAAVRTIGWSQAAPGLPYVTGLLTGVDEIVALRNGLINALDDNSLLSPRNHLRLFGFSVLPPGAYDTIAAMQAGAVDRGYPILA
jgi:ABC-type phosphate/phosphonate transport system substrate-binding protein